MTHGRYATYTGGCRCDDCRRAATEAKRRWRAGEKVLIDAGPVRRHLRVLSRAGVGLGSVSDVTDLNLTSLKAIKRNRRRLVRRSTAALILAVDGFARADYSLVDARRTKAAIREMRRLGLYHYEIAERIGFHAHTAVIHLLHHKRVRSRTEAHAIRALRQVKAELELERAVGPVCADCGLSHAPAARVARLRRFDRPVFADLVEAFPCIYPNTNTGCQLFTRDMRALEGRPREAARRAA